MEIFCFAMGVWYGFTYSLYLPMAVGCLFFISPGKRLLLFFILGYFVTKLHEQMTPQPNLALASVIASAQLQGSIASLPKQLADKTQFILQLDHINQQSAQGLVHLNWYDKAPELHPGERWQLMVKLRKPRNYQNPGSFDYVQSLARHHIYWTGYVLPKSQAKLLQKPQAITWLGFRDTLGRALHKLAPNTQTTAIVEALSLNITQHITPELWDLFRRTGTIHLFGISGEHIALVAGSIFGLVYRLWGFCTPWCLRIPAPIVASIAGLLAALVYAQLAGFEPPVQRALVGCLLFTLLRLGKQRTTPWQVWRYALFAVLCFEPHALFMQGFHFSFLAVACLLITAQRWPLSKYKAKMAAQIACLIGLMPLSLFWFSYGSINGLIANAFAIPWVGLLIVPLSLITLLCCAHPWSAFLMTALSWLIDCLIKGLQAIAHLEVLNVTFALPDLTWALCLMGALLLAVIFPIKPFKGIAVLWFLLSLLPTAPPIKKGEARIRVLDVGQGLAVVVQTQKHVLLYDTGDKFFRGRDLGSLVILPYLQTLRIHQIDTIVISHPDRDHRGGLKSLEENLVVKQLLVNDRKYYDHGSVCHEYPPWQWDGVDFRFFPITKAFKEKNNSSCILQVSNNKASLLLTGDIEKPAEENLVQTYGSALLSTALIIPHHGSKTSSSYAFIKAVSPHFAIISLGFDNRFHFPHAKTLHSLKALGIPLYRTDTCGMIEWLLPAKGQILIPHIPSCY